MINQTSKVIRYAYLFALVVFQCSLSELWANNPGGFTTLVTASVTTGTESYHSQQLNSNWTDYYLDNGILHVDIDPNTGNIDSIKYLKPGSSGTPSVNGLEMVSQYGNTTTSSTAFGNHAPIYFRWEQGATIDSMTHASMVTVQSSSSLIELALKQTYDSTKDGQIPMDMELHFVLGKGDTALYQYAVASHPASLSYGDLNLEIMQLIWPNAHDANNFLAEAFYVDDSVYTGLKLNGVTQTQNGLKETYYDANQAVTVPGYPGEDLQLTTGNFNGQLDAKYSYNVDYYTLGCWGRASDVSPIGAWMVFGSHEDNPGGLQKNEYTQGWGMTYYNMMTSHYNQPPVSVPSGTAWTKVFGPWMYYFNSVTGSGNSWTDAKNQATAEKGAWPYSWLASVSAYQKRTTVTGKLQIIDNLKPGVSAAGAWVGLAELDDGSENSTNGWQFQANGYQYWVQCAADGSFTIPDVAVLNTYGHTATYCLYAHLNGTSQTNGVPGETSTGGFTLVQNQTKDLGTLTWRVPHAGSQILWEIGIPDRTCSEFLRGDRYATPMIYLNFPTWYSNPINYNCNSGNWASVLNYAHSLYDGTNTWKWNLNFNLASVTSGGSYYLNIAFAGSDSAHEYISVNGNTPTMYTPVFQGGDGLQRLGDHCSYEVAHIAIPASRLNAAANTITLYESSSAKGWQPVLMYDYINFEAAPLLTNGTYQISNQGTGLALWENNNNSLTNSIYVGGFNASNPYDQWDLVNLGDDSSGRHLVQLFNHRNGFALNYVGSQITSETPNGSLDEVWQVVQQGSLYCFRNVGGGYKAMDVGATPSSGDNVQLNPCNYSSGQLWQMTAQ